MSPVTASPWTSTLLAITVVSGIPLAVTLLLAVNAGSVRRFLPHLSAFGAGALLGAAALQLVPEAISAGISPLEVLLGVVGGYAAFAFVERLLASHDHAHAHGLELGAPLAHIASGAEPDETHDADADHQHRAARSVVPLAFAGDTIHNLVDGMLIAASFLANPGFGFLTAVAIGLHELPRELGTFGMFVHGGVHPLKAVWYNVVTALVSFAGAAVTLLIGARVAGIGHSILPFAAGSYLYIAVAIGVPAVVQHQKRVPRAGRAAWLASGFALMGASALLAH